MTGEDFPGFTEYIQLLIHSLTMNCDKCLKPWTPVMDEVEWFYGQMFDVFVDQLNILHGEMIDIPEMYEMIKDGVFRVGGKGSRRPMRDEDVDELEEGLDLMRDHLAMTVAVLKKERWNVFTCHPCRPKICTWTH
jgi:hypothetical protein